jgi:Inner centromere protein, ARK binding region
MNNSNSNMQPLSLNTAESEIRKQKIAAQIRAKHLGMAHTSHTSTVPSNTLVSIVEPTASALRPVTSVYSNIVPSTAVPHQNNNHLYKVRPEDNYEISDREDSDDDDSESESSESSKRKKKIPEWAQRSMLVAALERQFSHKDGYQYVDPDELFGEVESCDLRDIFGSPKKANKYDRRASTGNWAKDRVTAAEKLAYKREHKMRVLKQQQCQ